MDKKNTAIGVALLAAAIGLFVYSSNQTAKSNARNADAARAQAALNTPAAPATPTPGATLPGHVAAPATTPVTPAAPEKLLKLSNEYIEATITTHGAGLKTVAMRKHAGHVTEKSETDPVLFNAEGPVPALSLSFPDPVTGRPAPWLANFEVKVANSERVVLESKRADGLIVTREFVLRNDDKKRDDHLIRTLTTFRRDGGVATPVVAGLNLGTVPPTEGDPAHLFLNTSVYDGEDYEKIGVDKFTTRAGFLGIGAHTAQTDAAHVKGAEPLRWVAISNQFFAGIATFSTESRAFATGLIARPVDIPESILAAPEPGKPVRTLTSDVTLNFGVIAPGETKILDVDYFVGPKEYTRLANLGGEQERTVQFGKALGFISIDWLCQLLMSALSFLHWIIPANPWGWGLAIVALTCIVKGITWPLTGMQMKAAENMKKLQEPMAKLKEQYKDNPQKMQQETMKLYKEHRVNPFAGCLPIFIQIPIFFGLYTAFQTCAELRHQPFLWFPDLSVADTIPGLPPYIHLMPILMGVTMLISMRMTPMANVDPTQKKLFYVMMAAFPIICYTSPAGLTTYWTVNNLLTILQTWLRKRAAAKKDAETAPGTIEIIPPEKSGKKKSKA